MSRRTAVINALSMVALTIAAIVGWRLIVGLPHAAALAIESNEGDSTFAYIAVFALAAVGSLIISRRPTHPIGWLYVICGLLIGTTAFATAYSQYAQAVPGALPAGQLAALIADASFLAGFGLPVTIGLLLFPDGHLPSPGWRWAAALTIVGFLILVAGGVLPLTPSIADIVRDIGNVVFTAAVVACVASLVWRWRAARGESRQQIKWVAAAGVAFGLLFVLQIVIAMLNSAFNEQWGFAVFTFGFSLVPIATGVAILRYRLYEIDFLISRTFVYGSLTAILAGLYAATIRLFQSLFVAITGQESDAALVITTLVLATTFTPIKGRLEGIARRRFAEEPESVTGRREPAEPETWRQELAALADRIGRLESALLPPSGRSRPRAQSRRRRPDDEA
jgi:hypothetical protein